MKRYEAARRILAISESVKRKILESGIDAEKVRVVYEGVVVPPEEALWARGERQRARQQWGVCETDLLLGSIGYLVPQKGHDPAIRAFAKARAEFASARFLLAGDGPCRAQLAVLAERLGVGEAVIFVGFVENVAQVYAALDIFVFPSLGEGLGTSLMAAMAWRLPVLAMASGGVPEYVEDGVNGLLAANPDAETLSAGMIQLLGDKALRERLGQGARRTIEERFSAAHMVDNTIRAYEEVLG